MTLAYWCLLIALFLPYLSTGVAKFTGGDFGPRQNHDPRTFLAGLTGWRKRADNAQHNAFEVTPAFAAALLAAHQIGQAPQQTLDLLAIGFVVSRVVYFACYLADWALLRSLVWFVGMALIAAFFFVSA
ncbi:MAPEG family protein [Pseudomonas sp. zfem003]|uniref:MAPEG family protein n=1 Tax=Pseudomonas sp. zfem003 TaxID=3078198 RepID=UPI002927FF76|nr:MAPEG family protein [Pseudomonas sp. zfem003]MDU9396632.1 MAPEG family protein [Pseudomonas sp. zfem003]